MEQEITTNPEASLQRKERNEKAIEVEEGEVDDSKHKKSKVVLLRKVNSYLSKENGENDEDGDKKAKDKKHKKEKKNKESKREREDSEERHKKKKESKSKNKKSDRKDRRSSSRSESPKKKHRSSPSFSKKSKSNRKKSVSSSNSRSRSKSKYESSSRRHKNRSRTPEKKHRRDRSDSRNRRRSPPRRHEGRDSRRSPDRSDRRRERSPVKQRDDRDKKREEKEKKVEAPKNDLEERIKATMEDEPADEEANQNLEMAFAAAEEDEERLARERREQRRKLLEQFAKANDQAEAQKQQKTNSIEEEEVPKEKAKEAPVVQEAPKKMVEEKVVPVVEEKKEEEKKFSIIEETKGKIEEEEDEDDDKEESKEEGVRKLSMMVQNQHNEEKEKKLKLIESMREQLQQEEEALNAEREEEEKRNKAKQYELAALKSAKKEQEFDMFAETPETLEAEKVSRPTLNVGQESYDDDQGYYRGQIGELIQERYQISAKLGKGVFGNVFKGIDTQTNQEIAIKVVKSDEIYTISGLKEREILTMLNTADKHNKRHVIRLLDSFEYRKHLVLIFELMEMDLRGAIKTFGKKLGLSIESVRSYARQLFIALSHLRKHKIIHADLKPDNILVTNGQKTLKLGDFGSAFTIEENTITPYLVARYYRAPEIMLGCAYDTAVDMWSAACTIFELYTGKILFSGRDNNEMLKMIIQTKGRFNNKMLKRGEFSRQYFDNHHNFLSTEIDPVTKEKYVKPIPIGNKITRDIGTLLNAVEIELSEEDQKKLAQLKELLERCLTLDPNKRLTPDEALSHPFINYGMQKIASSSNSIKHAF